MLPDGPEEWVIKSWEIEAGPSALEEPSTGLLGSSRDLLITLGALSSSVAARTLAQVLPLRVPEEKKTNYPASSNPLDPVRTQSWNGLELNGTVRSGPRGRATRDRLH